MRSLTTTNYSWFLGGNEWLYSNSPQCIINYWVKTGVTPHSVTKILQDSLYTLTLNPKTSGRFFHRICAFFCVTEYVLFCILVYHMHEERTKESKKVVWAFLVKTICKEKNKERKKQRNKERKKLLEKTFDERWASMLSYMLVLLPHRSTHKITSAHIFPQNTTKKMGLAWDNLRCICQEHHPAEVVFAEGNSKPNSWDIMKLSGTCSPIV